MQKLKYVLVMRNRPGQRQAVAWLPPETHRSQLTLLTEFDREDSAENEARALVDSAYGAGRIFADVERLRGSQRREVLAILGEGILDVVPVHVVKPQSNRAPDDEIGGSGMCLRVPAGAGISGARVNDRLGWLIFDGVRPDDIDLVWDLGALHSPRSVELLAAHVVEQLRRIEVLPRLRSVTLVGGSIPQDVWKFGRNCEAKIRRAEISIAPMVASGVEDSGTLITRGDYGTRCPEIGNTAPSGRPTPALYYSRENYTYLFRGNKIEHPGVQVARLAKKLAAEKFFRGPEFSVADQLIEEWAEKGVAAGHTANLIAVSLNHHICEELDRS